MPPLAAVNQAVKLPGAAANVPGVAVKPPVAVSTPLLEAAQFYLLSSPSPIHWPPLAGAAITGSSIPPHDALMRPGIPGAVRRISAPAVASTSAGLPVADRRSSTGSRVLQHPSQPAGYMPGADRHSSAGSWVLLPSSPVQARGATAIPVVAVSTGFAPVLEGAVQHCNITISGSNAALGSGTAAISYCLGASGGEAFAPVAAAVNNSTGLRQNSTVPAIRLQALQQQLQHQRQQLLNQDQQLWSQQRHLLRQEQVLQNQQLLLQAQPRRALQSQQPPCHLCSRRQRRLPHSQYQYAAASVSRGLPSSSARLQAGSEQRGDRSSPRGVHCRLGGGGRIGGSAGGACCAGVPGAEPRCAAAELRRTLLVSRCAVVELRPSVYKGNVRWASQSGMKAGGHSKLAALSAILH